MNLDLLKQLAEEAREVEEAIRPLMPGIGTKGYVSNEVWCAANWLADDLEAAYLEALGADALSHAVLVSEAKQSSADQPKNW